MNAAPCKSTSVGGPPFSTPAPQIKDSPIRRRPTSFRRRPTLTSRNPHEQCRFARRNPLLYLVGAFLAGCLASQRRNKEALPLPMNPSATQQKD